jgi:hypothetical protein
MVADGARCLSSSPFRDVGGAHGLPGWDDPEHELSNVAARRSVEPDGQKDVLRRLETRAERNDVLPGAAPTPVAGDRSP